MAKRGSAVHVTMHRRHYTGKDGVERVYETALLRRSFREDGKVRNETVANLSHLPADTIELVRGSLNGERYVPAGARDVLEGMEDAADALINQFPEVMQLEPTIEGLNDTRLVVILGDEYAEAIGLAD